jgi:serine/threonine-protein kinase CTR1
MASLLDTRTMPKCGVSGCPISAKLVAPDLFLPESLLAEPGSLQQSEKLGTGSFGSVTKGVYKGSPVAVKTLFPGKASEAFNVFSLFWAEAMVWAPLQHPSIARLQAVTLEPLGFVMELLTGGPLDTFLAAEPLGWDSRLKIALDIAAGLEYMHSRSPPVIHRDLKSPNVLVLPLPLVSTDFLCPACRQVSKGPGDGEAH